MAYGDWLAGVPHHLDVDRASSENLKVSSPPIGGKCLTAAGTGNSSAVTISSCTGATSQQWTLNANSTITNTASGRCLDAVGQGTANGTQLQIYDCVTTGQPNQQWTLR